MLAMKQLDKVKRKIRRLRRPADGSKRRFFGRYEPAAPEQARKKSMLLLRDLIIVFILFAAAFIFANSS